MHRLSLSEVFGGIRVWTKVEQRCFAVIDFKNRKVIKSQRGEEKQCAD
jgi:hypothetical protein